MRWLAVEIAKVLTNVISLPYGGFYRFELIF